MGLARIRPGTGVLTIWLAWVQCCAGVLERVVWLAWNSAARVRLDGCSYHLSGRENSAARVRLNGCSYRLAGRGTVLRGCT